MCSNERQPIKFTCATSSGGYFPVTADGTDFDFEASGQSEKLFNWKTVFGRHRS